MNTTTAEQTTCRRCGRTLRTATSRALGYGPRCLARIRRATELQLAGFTPAQRASVRELIEDGAIIPLRRTIFLAVSNDGTAVHRTDSRGHCTCPAGLRRTPCYHVAAARMLLAA